MEKMDMGSGRVGHRADQKEGRVGVVTGKRMNATIYDEKRRPWKNH